MKNLFFTVALLALFGCSDPPPVYPEQYPGHAEFIRNAKLGW